MFEYPGGLGVCKQRLSEAVPLRLFAHVAGTVRMAAVDRHIDWEGIAQAPARDRSCRERRVK